MLVKDVIDFLNSYAPLDYAEDFDNTGLIVGNKNDKVNGIIICLDTTKEIVQEAINLNKNLIISFHPIIFKGLKNNLVGTRYHSLIIDRKTLNKDFIISAKILSNFLSKTPTTCLVTSAGLLKGPIILNIVLLPIFFLVGPTNFIAL